MYMPSSPSFSDTHACKELHKRSHRFALQNFQEVMSTEEFLLLPFSEVRALLKIKILQYMWGVKREVQKVAGFTTG